MTKIAGVLFIISLICIIAYVMLRDSLVQQPVSETKSSAKVQLTSPTPLQPIPLSDESTLKIAVPDGVQVEIIDDEGKVSGMMSTGYKNDIENSEVRLDGMLGTVTWIVLTSPRAQNYSLKVTGSSDKAVALYVKNSAGFEGLELLETQTHDPQKTYTFKVSIIQDTAQQILKITAQ